MKTACLVLIALLFCFIGTDTFSQVLFFKDSGQNRKFFTFKKRVIKPEKYRAVTIDISGLKKFLDTVPSENMLVDRKAAPLLLIIKPDGNTASFRVWNSPVEESKPGTVNEVSTFVGQGIDDPYATIRFDIGSAGFHAQVRTVNGGDYFIDPYALGEKKKYISYFRSDLKKDRTTGSDVVEPSQPVRNEPEAPAK